MKFGTGLSALKFCRTTSVLVRTDPVGPTWHGARIKLYRFSQKWLIMA